jgi:dTDP-6-deoxy-L-talose 4-dehydrogenase (NAD+)
MLAAGLDLVDVLAAAGCRRCVMLGTCAEYDTATAEVLREDSPLRPTTLYASAKMALSILARARAEAGGMLFAWARLFHPYGPRERPERLVASACRTLAAGRPFALRNPDARRDLVHVEDVARAVADLVEAGADGSFNVATGRATSVREAVAIIAAAAGRSELVSVERQPRPGWDPDSIWGSPELLTATTGWSPRVPVEAGLASTYAWWAGSAGSPD